jgi:hypothetical protein
MKRFALILSALLLGVAPALASTTTANMSLLIPSTGDTDYGTSMLTSLGLIDLHDHSSGKGIQIPAGGLASNSVTSAKIVDGTIVTADLADSSVTSAKIVDGTIATADIADGAITQAKRAALGQQISASSDTFSTGSATYVAVTNLSVSITTTGRPVILFLQPDGSANLSLFGPFISGSGQPVGAFEYLRGSTELGAVPDRWDVKWLWVPWKYPAGRAPLHGRRGRRHLHIFREGEEHRQRVNVRSVHQAGGV